MTDKISDADRRAQLIRKAPWADRSGLSSQRTRLFRALAATCLLALMYFAPSKMPQAVHDVLLAVLLVVVVIDWAEVAWHKVRSRRRR